MTATTVLTGKDLTLTITAVNYDHQVTKFKLSNAPVIEIVPTLAGRAYAHTDDQWTLQIDYTSDWGQAVSLCKALWNAADSAPNTVIACVATVVSGNTFAFNIMPAFPAQGGALNTPQEDSLSFLVVGKPAATLAP